MDSPRSGHAEDARKVLFRCVYDVGRKDGRDGEVPISHVDHLRNLVRWGNMISSDCAQSMGARMTSIGLQVVEEEFEITDDDELADPAFLDPAGARDFDVALVSGADPSRRIDAERPLRLIRRNRTSGRRFFRTTNVARE